MTEKQNNSSLDGVNIRQIGLRPEEGENSVRVGTIQMEGLQGLPSMGELDEAYRTGDAEYKRVVALVEATVTNPSYKPVDKVSKGRVVALLREAAWRAHDNNFDLAIGLATQALEQAKANLAKDTEVVQ
jgi:hypothetical protein